MKSRAVAASVAFWALLTLLPLSALSSQEPVLKGLAEEKATLEVLQAQTGLSCQSREAIVQCNYATNVGPQIPTFPNEFCVGFRGTTCGLPGGKTWLNIDSTFSPLQDGSYRLSQITVSSTRAARRADAVIRGLDASIEAALEARLAADRYGCRAAGSEGPHCLSSILAGGGCLEEHRLACHLPGSDALLKPDAMVGFIYWSPSTARGRQKGDFVLDSIRFEF